MSLANSQRKGCKDVFNAFLVSTATYAGFLEFPRIKPTYDIPNRVIAFSKAIKCKDYNQWVHFYEDDHLFERIWRNPRRYLAILKRYRGVILADFSLYRDMPLIMQLWNIYRSRAIGHWLQANGIIVIPNIRFGDRRTYRICCEGISKHCTIAVGAHGNMKHKVDRDIFLNGLDEIVKILEPNTIVVYGSAPKDHYQKYIDAGITVVNFDSEYSASHKGVE